MANTAPINGTMLTMPLPTIRNIGRNGAVPVTSPFFLIRLTHTHESFRVPELEALATSLNVNLEVIDYQPTSPFCVVRLQPRNTSQPLTPQQYHSLARKFGANSILAKSIHELYATATTYEELHSQIKSLPSSTWTPYRNVSFKFSIDAFFGKRSTVEQRSIIESFSYLPFQGKIVMKQPDEEFVVSEEWELLTPEEHSILNTGSDLRTSEICGESQTGTVARSTEVLNLRKPKRLFFTRYIGLTKRDLIDKHDLKKRPYISTTSMDAELALITANLALASAGKLFLDPFVGTGGFMIAAAELGAVTLGSDIDGRSFRGKGTGLERGVGRNFSKYQLQNMFGDCLTSDLTNSPFGWPGKVVGMKSSRWLDGIICDPPYGIREGLKVLGRRSHDPATPSSESGAEKDDSNLRRATHDGPYFVGGVPSHTLPGFIAPKRPYSFNRMLDDILDFAARTLVDGGRLAFWMPSANENTEEEFPIPRHCMLELKHVCVQSFNKWSRRLLVYRRIVGEIPEVLANKVSDLSLKRADGTKADELNQFRRMYFRGFNNSDPQPPRNDHG
ncbi:hypothetical protein H2198_003384 [Neophaeococcomyces mojaviensis]|uniref:Uncharacterized protein n=1 Tax=Neophaeococcomyces mojaviensis TaxID=3383035 RepID=A0ACC3ABD7_9EURO|nr:hypothetical protein H2198_003384 [Knufia sp. JES_112]